MASAHLVMNVMAVARAPSALVARAAPSMRRVDVRRRLFCSARMGAQLPVAALSFDLETTGLDTATAEVVQLAIVVSNSQRGAQFQSLVLPERSIDPGAAAVHGFTKEVLIEAGARPFGEVWGKVEEWLAETVGDERPLVWAAHNGDRYDRPILDRCVRAELGSLPASIDSGGRATWVDTLPMARHCLPGRRYAGGRGPYTLGSLYFDATGGTDLEGAHDAMADAQALSAVWKWLVEDGGAGAGLYGAEEERALTAAGSSRFQAHLQALAYSAGPPPTWLGRGAAAAAAAKPKAKPRARQVPGAVGKPLGGGSLTDVPGVGAAMEGRLRGKGIETYEDLENLWNERGRDRAKMIGWMRHAMPGCNTMALARLVKGMQTEFGA